MAWTTVFYVDPDKPTKGVGTMIAEYRNAPGGELVVTHSERYNDPGDAAGFITRARAALTTTQTLNAEGAVIANRIANALNT